MFHPMIAETLVTGHQAELRRTAAAEQRYHSARREQAAEQQPPRVGLLHLVRLRWHARRHQLAQRHYPPDWQGEVRAIAERRTHAK
jgi:hypothetical protein